ncbi:MAG: MotA/TolQ/ExbB proton channel family protein [Nostoc sp.]|uniref:MotA/TolQ/ExbB proton channel family protein n=1 Tax=Nostoc sp. TaxID=1180 RepID=UPI002FFCDD01
MGIQNLFEAGGIVMLPLLAFSVLAGALMIERAKFWLQIGKRQNRVVRDVLSLYRLDNVVGAVDKLQKNVDLPIARIFLAGLQLERPTPEKFRLALKSEAQAEIPILKRFQAVFDTIIGLAPLLGLLGTILGLIRSFAGLNIGDVGGTKTGVVTSGISEALVATASGLVVAIFVLLGASIFRGLYQRQITMIQEYGGQLEILFLDRYEQLEHYDKQEKSYGSR